MGGRSKPTSLIHSGAQLAPLDFFFSSSFIISVLITWLTSSFLYVTVPSHPSGKEKKKRISSTTGLTEGGRERGSSRPTALDLNRIYII